MAGSSWRVPLHPEDAAYHRGLYDQSRYAAEDIESAMRQQDMARLAVVGQFKKDAERAMRLGVFPGQSGREVDQDAAARYGANVADRAGATGRSAYLQALHGLSKVGEWSESTPESRNVFMQTMLIPEHAIMHTAEALSAGPDGEPRSRSEVLSRLAWALPASVYPDLGYPIQPARDRMYEELGPAAIVADNVMPGLGSFSELKGAANALRYGRGAPTYLVDPKGNAIRRLINSPRVLPLGLQYTP